MKFKIVCMSVLLITSPLMFSMDKGLIQLPEKAILEKNLTEMHFNHFLKNTKLVERLAGEEKSALQIILIVDEESERYCKNIRKKSNTATAPLATAIIGIFRQTVPSVYKALFKDMPEELKQVKKQLKETEEYAEQLDEEKLKLLK